MKSEKQSWRWIALLCGSAALVWLAVGITVPVMPVMLLQSLISLLIGVYSYRRYLGEPEDTPVKHRPWPKDGIFGRFNRRDYRLSMVNFGLGMIVAAAYLGSFTHVGTWTTLLVGVFLVVLASVNQYSEPALPSDPPE